MAGITSSDVGELSSPRLIAAMAASSTTSSTSSTSQSKKAQVKSDHEPHVNHRTSFIMQTVNPTLTAGLAALCSARPGAAPLKWLGHWLQANSQSPKGNSNIKDVAGGLDAQYLQSTLGNTLAALLALVATAQREDPVGHLAELLMSYEEADPTIVMAPQPGPNSDVPEAAPAASSSSDQLEPPQQVVAVMLSCGGADLRCLVGPFADDYR
jgi:hypothetical protein